ncbi:MAG: sialidase family protein [Planctomycetota bacterium]
MGTTPGDFLRWTVLAGLAAAIAAAGANAEEQTPMSTDTTSVHQQPLYEHQGKNYYRIPGLLATTDGTLLAFCQHRKSSVSDHGHDSDNLVRRSTDGGKTWSPPVVVATSKGVDIHTGPVVQHRRSGRIYKFCRYWPVKNAKAVLASTPYRQMRERGLIDHVSVSDDDGKTWSAPEPIVLPFPDDARSVGVGNGVHGIQLANGDLAIAGGYRQDAGARVNLVLLSSDGGATWRAGAKDPNASSIREFIFAQLSDGRVYCNFRNNKEGDRRLTSLAPADLSSFGDIRRDRHLPEPVAHAGVNFIQPTRDRPEGVLLFSNPNVRNVAGRWNKHSRRKMTVRASLDSGKTWSHAVELWEGPAAYSDIAVTQEDGAWFVHVLYEQGDDPEEYARYSKRVVHAKLPLAALLASPAADYPPDVIRADDGE